MKKAVVIPHHVYQQMLKSVANNQSAASNSASLLENELKVISTSNDPIEKKNFLYQQALFKYLQSAHSDKKDIILPVLDEAAAPLFHNVEQQELLKNGHNPQSEQENVTSASMQLNTASPTSSFINAKSAIDIAMQESLSKHNKEKGMQLYNMLCNRGRGAVAWDDIGQIFINETKIPNSNIIDIVVDLLNTMGTAPQPHGFKELVPYLREMNIPLHLLRNRMRSKTILNAGALEDKSSVSATTSKLVNKWKKF